MILNLDLWVLLAALSTIWKPAKPQAAPILGPIIAVAPSKLVGVYGSVELALNIAGVSGDPVKAEATVLS